MKKLCVLILFFIVCHTLQMEASQAAPLQNEVGGKAANVNLYPITVMGERSTEFSMKNSYIAQIPQVISFFDSQGRYHVAYEFIGKIYIQRYDANMNLVDSLEVKKAMSLFGGVTCDAEGNYYIVYGEPDPKYSYEDTLCVVKYNSQGNRLLKKSYGYASMQAKGYDNAALIPFQKGTCSLTINNGVLAIHYAGEMYSRGQENGILYVDMDTLELRSGYQAVSSHSHDQRIISSSDGGFLAVSQGDAYDRGFLIDKINSSLQKDGAIWNFHFREGTDECDGHCKTYAQLGGIVETQNAYVFCGSSEKPLSLEYAPFNAENYVHHGAKNLFVQVLKKDFYNYNGAQQYKLTGETRVPTGIAPDDCSKERFLTGTERDDGVVWLTDYDGDYYVENPKIVAIPNSRYVVMWEKRAYKQYLYEWEASYYAVLDENGNVIEGPIRILNTKLAGNIDPVYRDGRVYWTTSGEEGAMIHSLEIYNPIDWVPVSKIETPDIQYIPIGVPTKLSTVVYPTNATFQKLTYQTSRSDLFNIDENGYVTAQLSPSGMPVDIDVRLTSQDGLVSTVCKLAQVNFVLGNLDSDSMTIEAGTEKGFFARLAYPETYETGRCEYEFDYTVSDKAIISVEQSGTTVENMKFYVKGKKPGQSKITIKDKKGYGAVKVINVTVINQECDIYFNETPGVNGKYTRKTINYGEPLGTLPTPTREGYTFQGWYTKLDGGEKISAQTVCDGSKSYYAHWVKSEKDENGSGQDTSQDTEQGSQPGSSSEATSELTPENNYDNEKDYRYTIPVSAAGKMVASNKGLNFYEDSNGNKRCYKENGVPVVNEFTCDGIYTYYFQLDGTCMKSRLSYHPDGEHVIYFDEYGHEVFSNFANVKMTVGGEAVDDFCFFDVHGYLYVDVVTFDQTGTKLYYANEYGVMKRGEWFKFSENAMWADGNPFDKAGGEYGYATEDGSLLTNTQTYDWEGRPCYLQGNGVAVY